jgi:hypothetical protein
LLIIIGISSVFGNLKALLLFNSNHINTILDFSLVSWHYEQLNYPVLIFFKLFAASQRE